MSDDTRDTNAVLASSTDPDELYAVAAALVTSPDAGDHAALADSMSKEGFLARLDSEKDYRAGTRFLRVARLLKGLKSAAAPSARQVLVQLTQAGEFVANWTRADLLIKAVVIFRPPPAPVLKFWDEHFQPEDGFMNLTAQALAENGTEPAIALLEKKLADDRFEDEERVWWMRTAVLTHRYDLPMLRACQRLVSAGLTEPPMRRDLVEALFDYQPLEWHGPDDGYPPPPLERASPEARRLLTSIGQYALENVALTSDQRKVVGATTTALAAGP